MRFSHTMKVKEEEEYIGGKGGEGSEKMALNRANVPGQSYSNKGFGLDLLKLS